MAVFLTINTCNMYYALLYLFNCARRSSPSSSVVTEPPELLLISPSILLKFVLISQFKFSESDQNLDPL